MIIFKLIVDAIRHLVSNDPPAPPPEPKPFPSPAEIDAKLGEIAQQRGLTNLNWQESIVDLLALLDIKNDFYTRGVLYADLGGESGDYTGASTQNTWMIQQVRQRFAAGQVD